LAGGKSTRLGVDKAMIHFQGATLLNNLVKTVSQFSNHVIVVSKDTNHHKPNTNNVQEESALGPLNGLLNGLKKSNNEWSLVLSVDMPFLDLSKLVEDLEKTLNDNIIAAIPINNNKKQFLAGFYHKRAISIIEYLIASQQFAMKSLFETNNEFVELVDSSNNFANLNQIQDIHNENLSLVEVMSFGRIQELFKLHKQSVLTLSRTVHDFQIELEKDYPFLKDTTYSIAVNQNIENPNHGIKSGDVIALLPPFAGG